MDLALLLLRGVIGLLFVAHGSQTLFGVFGGGGLGTVVAGRISVARDGRGTQPHPAA
jgi:uncharacterized membrane protein YphA (DoxX/SURF4 family)